MSVDLHDALRAQGLVPAGEDVHFLACSTDYRQRLNEVSGAIPDPDDYAQVERNLRSAEDKIEELEEEVDDLGSKVDGLEISVGDAEAELAALRTENASLKKRLESKTEQETA